MDSIIDFAEFGTEKFDNFKRRLLMKPGGRSTYALNPVCQGKIGDQFVEDAINNATYLFVNIYKGDIIGFAAVMYYSDDNISGKTYLYIELICNAPGYGMSLRSNINRRGAKDMIKSIEQLGKQLGSSYIKLSAIDAVIPYYYRLGFNFSSVYDKNGEEINQYLQTKASGLINQLRSAQKDQDTEEQEMAMIQIIQRFYPTYLSESHQAILAPLGKRERTGPARDQGIPMIKLIQYSDESGFENPLRGGRKTKSVPMRYIPKKLTSKDKKKQREMLKKSRKMYKRGKYFTRNKLKSFRSKTSSHITKAKKLYNVDKIIPSNKLSRKSGCSKKALSKIVKKGEGAYYSSGSRPNQSAQSWGYARLASSITGGKSAAVDFNILKKGCKNNSRALKLAKKSRKKHGYGKRKTPQVKL